jgi:hypothetical protein
MLKSEQQVISKLLIQREILHYSNKLSASVVWWLSCLPAGSNPAKDDAFLRTIKIRNTTIFGGKQSR